MPTMREAAVAVTGTVLDIEFTTDFETKKPDGNARVLVNTGDGFAQVKVNKEDLAAANPGTNAWVAWMVRYGAWSRNDNAQATCRFVRPLSENDVDQLVSAAGFGAPAGK